MFLSSQILFRRNLMKKLFFLFVCVLVLYSCSNPSGGGQQGDGQTLQGWARSVTGGGNLSYFDSVTIDSSGYIYAVGFQRGNGTYNYGGTVSAIGSSTGTSDNVVLVKYDLSGNAQWAKSVTGGGNASDFYAVTTRSGSIYAVGTQRGNGTYNYGGTVSVVGSYTGEYVVLVKYD
jgi:hypothetical protein